MDDILKSGYYECHLGYNIADWFVIEVIKLGNKMAVYFKNTKKDIIMTEEDEKHHWNNNFCQFCEKNIGSDKIRDHCHLTDKVRGPAHKKCNKNVTQKESSLIAFVLHNFSKYDCHLFF